jgi:hypothetical protein
MIILKTKLLNYVQVLKNMELKAEWLSNFLYLEKQNSNIVRKTKQFV